jgi:hypothetical protein
LYNEKIDNMNRGKIPWKTMDRHRGGNGRHRIPLPIKLLFFIFIPIFFFPSTGHSSMIKLSLERLSMDSDTIVLGEVKDIECQWSMDRSTIMTIVTLQIQDVIKGELRRNQILIQYPGGEIGEIGLKVSDMPDFHLRERTLVFLRSLTDLNDAQNSLLVAMNFWPAFTVFGAAQGKYSIDNKGIARKGGYSLISKKPDSDRTLSLEDLITRIRKSIRQNVPEKKKIREKR